MGVGRGVLEEVEDVDEVEELEDLVDVGVVVEETDPEPIAGVEVSWVKEIWAKEEEGRISDRKRKAEEKGSDLEHPQDGFACRLERIFMCRLGRY